MLVLQADGLNVLKTDPAANARANTEAVEQQAITDVTVELVAVCQQLCSGCEAVIGAIFAIRQHLDDCLNIDHSFFTASLSSCLMALRLTGLLCGSQGPRALEQIRGPCGSPVMVRYRLLLFLVSGTWPAPVDCC